MENTENSYARNVQRRPLLVKRITKEKTDKGKEETPKRMIRSLQSIFIALFLYEKRNG